MPNFRRYYIPNSIVFITAVTNGRIPYLDGERNLSLFWETMRHTQQRHPFHLLAYVILPEHFHWLLRVEDPSGNSSPILHSVKRNYTLNFKRAHGLTTPLQLWQARFWDHVIRDDRDLERHFDYVHYNPVKHGYVTKPEDWSESTYSHWLERGYYTIGWGHDCVPDSIAEMEYE